MITYEFPLNERIRTLLRLEDLFAKSACYLASDAPELHHAALVSLFDIQEVGGRADLKFDLMQELERQRQILVSFRKNPAISQEALDETLAEIAKASAALLAVQGRFGSHIRESDWLMSIKNRIALPGGTCEFDLPSYHYWLNSSTEERRADLDSWVAPFEPIRQASEIVLRLLRASGHPETHIATRGNFHLMLAGRTAHMARIRLERSEPFVPEISASKYALNVRLMSPEKVGRPKQATTDVKFEITFCNL